MALSPALAAQLAALTASIDEPELDLGHQLDLFSGAVRAAVPSYLGMKLTVHSRGQPITFSHWDSDTVDGVQASVAVALIDPAGVDEDATLVLWAATPGAFVDLAADLSHLLGVPLAGLHLDAHHDVSAMSGIDGIDEFAVVNQAIGVLIARGATPESAAAELRRRGTGEHQVRAARIVVSSAEKGD